MLSINRCKIKMQSIISTTIVEIHIPSQVFFTKTTPSHATSPKHADSSAILSDTYWRQHIVAVLISSFLHYKIYNGVTHSQSDHT